MYMQCCPLMNYANSFNPDRARQNVDFNIAENIEAAANLRFFYNKKKDAQIFFIAVTFNTCLFF